jgi:hypothetical protein
VKVDVEFLKKEHLINLEEQLMKMNSQEQRKIEEFSQNVDFWEAFVKCGYGQIAAFIAMTNEGPSCKKRKKTLINDMYRYANAYKDMGYHFISKKVLLQSQEISKNFEELKTP